MLTYTLQTNKKRGRITVSKLYICVWIYINTAAFGPCEHQRPLLCLWDLGAPGWGGGDKLSN